MIDSFGPVRWRRRTAFVFEARNYEQDEWYFVVHVPRFDARPASLTELEVRSNTGWRWWSIVELEASAETIYPRELGRLLRSLANQSPTTRTKPAWID